MKITVSMPTPLEIENVKVDEPGGAIAGDLIFYGRGDETAGPSIKVETSKGKVLFNGYLCVSGTTGKPSLIDRSSRVVPKAEQ